MNTLQNTCFQFKENGEASKECKRILDEKYERHNPLLNWWMDGHFYRVANSGIVQYHTKPLHYDVISATKYLALLTAKPLTESDLIVGNRFECIENMYDNNAMKILFEKGKVYKCVKFHILNGIYLHNDTLNRHFKLLPTTQEKSVKGDDEIVQLFNQNTFEVRSPDGVDRNMNIDQFRKATAQLLTNSRLPFQIHHHAKTILVSIEFKQGKYSEHKCFSDETESGMIKQVEKCLKKNT